jgi:hypothetical protein
MAEVDRPLRVTEPVLSLAGAAVGGGGCTVLVTTAWLEDLAGGLDGCSLGMWLSEENFTPLAVKDPDTTPMCWPMLSVR